MIQFGNRYRSSHDIVAESLREAEAKFRSYEYQAALETAATAIEKGRPRQFTKNRGEHRRSPFLKTRHGGFFFFYRLGGKLNHSRE
ncbi:septation ring formation regulator EzrA [Peribacillus frigoritolerans]|nr:septation ring formation regulator EzrA [Peribacillus frigoritolerans]